MWLLISSSHCIFFFTISSYGVLQQCESRILHCAVKFKINTNLILMIFSEIYFNKFLLFFSNILAFRDWPAEDFYFNQFFSKIHHKSHTWLSLDSKRCCHHRQNSIVAAVQMPSPTMCLPQQSQFANLDLCKKWGAFFWILFKIVDI